MSNTAVNANALAAADTYIQNFRKGTCQGRSVGTGTGTTVGVSLKRHAFQLWHGRARVQQHTDVNNYLGSNGTAKQTNYQSRLNLNFNAVVPENMGKWSIQRERLATR